MKTIKWFVLLVFVAGLSAQPYIKCGLMDRARKAPMERPTDLPVTYDSPSGHFKLHYTTEATSPNRATTEYVHRLAELFDEAWAYEVDSLGYLPPPSDSVAGGDSRYDIYIRDMYYYGITTPELPGDRPWNDYTSYIEIENDFAGFPDNMDPEGTQIGCMKVTSAHEFFHSIQLGYNGDISGNNLWFMEMSSVWMEDKVHDETNDYLSYMDDFFSAPHTGLTLASFHCYSTCIFLKYIDQALGIEFIKRIWENMRYGDAITSLTEVLDSAAGGFDENFATFTQWNYFTGSHDDGAHYHDAALFPEVYIESSLHSYPASGSTDHRPNYLGSNYILTTDFPDTFPALELLFDGSSSTDWVVSVLVRRRAGGSYESHIYTSDAAGDISALARELSTADTAIFIAAPIRGNVNSEYQTFSLSWDAHYSTSVLEASLPQVDAAAIFPNPSPGYIQMATNGKIEIFDLGGRFITGTQATENQRLSLNLPPGLYLYRVTTKNNQPTGKLEIVH